MQGKHTTVIGLLTASNATLSLKNPSAELCTAASAGDLTQVRRLVDNRVDPNSGDYDKRTALHLAASEGHDKVVEYLLSSKADPSPIDRWGSTPLNDALKNVHELVAKLLQTKGATIKNDASSLAMLCEASARGNVKRMRLMHDYGQRTDKGDYDFRYPLHLAAAEGRILAVSFLLGISSDPTCQDRWGSTPMDDAFRGGTLYHVYCAKLIQGWGGELSANIAASPEGEKFTKQLENISINHVRLLIKRLIEKQYDKVDPIFMSDEDVKVAFGATMKLIPFATELQFQCKNFAEEIHESDFLIADKCRELQTKTLQLLNVLKYGSTEPSHDVEPSDDASSRSTKRVHKDDQPRQEIEHDVSASSASLHFEPTEFGWMPHPSSPLQDQVAGVNLEVNFGSDTQESMQSGSTNLCTDEARRHIITPSLIHSVPPNCLTECFEFIKQTEDSAKSGTYDTVGIDFLENFDVDSDEEMARYEEIDEIVETLNFDYRKNDKNVRWEKAAARSFLKFALSIHDIEATFEKFCNVFTGTTFTANESEPEVTFGELSSGLKRFKIQTAEMDIEGLFEAAHENWERETETEEDFRELFDSKTSALSVRFLVSNSVKFRRIFLDMQVCE